jgi:hypothetical protein
VQGIEQLCRLAWDGSSRVGTKGVTELLSSPAATAALASALSIIIKLCVQKTRQQAGRQQDAVSGTEEALGMVEAAAVLFMVLKPLSGALYPALPDTAAAAGDTAGSSSREQQISASAEFLLVLVCRGAVAMHQAAMRIPGVSAAGLGPDATWADIAMDRGATLHQYMTGVLAVLMNVFSTLDMTSMDRLGAGVWGTTSSAAAAEPADTQQASSRSSSSSQAVCWQHLLRLHESRKLAAACDTHWRQWSPSFVNAVNRSFKMYAEDLIGRPYTAAEAVAAASGGQLQQMRQLYHDALGFCRTLTAVAPLPVVNNNPWCVELRGVSEAAAARYACAGCGCRYCSAACQAAGWRSHKKACRRMAACGMRVQGR